MIDLDSIVDGLRVLREHDVVVDGAPLLSNSNNDERLKLFHEAYDALICRIRCHFATVSTAQCSIGTQIRIVGK
jgi:hypothetical protein